MYRTRSYCHIGKKKIGSNIKSTSRPAYLHPFAVRPRSLLPSHPVGVARGYPGDVQQVGPDRSIAMGREGKGKGDEWVKASRVHTQQFGGMTSSHQQRVLRLRADGTEQRSADDSIAPADGRLQQRSAMSPKEKREEGYNQHRINGNRCFQSPVRSMSIVSG